MPRAIGAVAPTMCVAHISDQAEVSLVNGTVRANQDSSKLSWKIPETGQGQQ